MERYHRQLILPEIGPLGQKKLASARILIVGVGGLGSSVALYLTVAGIGELGIIDDDIVNISNLNRQILYAEGDCGRSKVECAAMRIRALRNDISLHTYAQRINHDNVADIISKYDIIIDACDNMSTRHIVANATRIQHKPYIYGAINGHEGMVSVFNYGSSPHHLSDLWPMVENEEQQALEPALGVTAGIVGCVEANEAIKIICEYGELLAGRLWTIDLRTMQSIIVEL